MTDIWIIATITTIVTMSIGYAMGIYAPWLDKRESLKAQQAQIKVTAQKRPVTQPQQIGGVHP